MSIKQRGPFTNGERPCVQSTVQYKCDRRDCWLESAMDGRCEGWE